MTTDSLTNLEDASRPACLPGNFPAARPHHGKPAKPGRVCRSRRGKRSGAAAVEFALVAPIFFLTILGMVELGRAVMVKQILTNASREGARNAVLDGATASSVTTFVTTYLSNASIKGATVTFPQGNPESATYGSPVNVTVSIPFSKVTWVSAPMYLSGQTLSASTVMRREAVQ